MKCKKCEYLRERGYEGQTYCEITHICNPRKCKVDTTDNLQERKICYNCKHWMGVGDFGLSCDKHYEVCTANGFERACDDFEPKVKSAQRVVE